MRIFGKLPTHGDFVARGLAMEDRGALDRWLSRSLAEARDALGEADFGERYDRAPPWRFVIGDQEGRSYEAGALAPSIDSAGRRFPIYLALDEVERRDAEAVAEICEGLLYDALGDGWDVAALETAAASAVPGIGAAAPGNARWWTLGGEDFAPASLEGARPAGLMLELLRRREEAA